MPLNMIPSLDDLVLGKVVANNVGQWKVPLEPCSDPCFLMSLALHVFAEPLFLLVDVKMCSLPESVRSGAQHPPPSGQNAAAWLLIA